MMTLFAALCVHVPSARAANFYFAPDTSHGDVGQTILVSGMIDSTALMRGYTIYMTYDTNVVDLAEPPVVGSLLAGHEGLQFNYFDHAAFLPNALEITATIFGTALWQGPGELFRARFVLRQCGAPQMTAPYPPFFIAADNTYPTVTYHPPAILICSLIPAHPQDLTIYPDSSFGLRLFWNTVTQDTNGQTLPNAPAYQIYRQQMIPSPQPEVIIATVSDTSYEDSTIQDGEWIYHVSALPAP